MKREGGGFLFILGCSHFQVVQKLIGSARQQHMCSLIARRTNKAVEQTCASILRGGLCVCICVFVCVWTGSGYNQ